MALYIMRILFAKNNLQPSVMQKIKANLGGGFLADQWVLYDFDHNDKKEYLSEFDWYKSRYINEPFNFMLNNKIVASEVLKQYVRVPENYIIKNKGHLTNLESEEVSYLRVVELLEIKKKLFMKPFGMGKGKGVYILSYERDQVFIDDTVIKEEEFILFLTKNDNWFISEVMEQADYANKIYDKTWNTIRLITLRDIEDKKFKVFFAVQRIGTFKTIPVDNGSRGGLVARIDLETGMLSEARSLHSLEVHEHHPDSKAPIKGIVIPSWDKIMQETLDLAEKLPYMHFIAWDILMTEEGISIIEANTSSGVNIIQLWGGQRNSELGAFYRYHNVIK